MDEAAPTLTVRGPSLAAHGPELRAWATLTPPDGEPLPVAWWVPSSLAGWINPTLDAWVPLATTLAAARGWDLSLAGPVDPTLADGARTAAAELAPSVGGRRTPRIIADKELADHTSEVMPGRHGLCFVADLASWASLRIASGSIAAPSAEEHPRPIDDLVVIEWPLDHVRPADGSQRAGAAAALATETARVAEGTGIPVRRVRAELGTGEGDHGPISLGDCDPVAILAAGAGLLLGNGLTSWSIPGGRPGACPSHWSTGRTTVTKPLASTDLVALAHLVGHDPEVASGLGVCRQSSDGTNCARCGDCLATATALTLAGTRTPTLPVVPTPAAVIAADDRATRWADQLGRHLGTEVELAAAWATHGGDGRRRQIIAGGTVAMTGPDAWSRVAAALTATGQRPDVTGPIGEETTIAAAATDPLEVGWGPGQVPLRPRDDQVATILSRWGSVGGAQADGWVTNPAADHRARQPEPASAGRGDRPIAWSILEPADPGRRRDTGQARLTLAAESAWGPGRVYLTGLGWGDDQAGVISGRGRGRLLAATTTRVWWREEGDLDALRLLECAEAGCAGLQVMPPGSAVLARRRLPAVLAPVVVGVNELAGFEPRDRGWFAPVVAWVTTGSLERDLAHEAAANPPPTRGHAASEDPSEERRPVGGDTEEMG